LAAPRCQWEARGGSSDGGVADTSLRRGVAATPFPRPPESLGNAALFLGGDEADFNLLESGLLQPAVDLQKQAVIRLDWVQVADSLF
jgi:hypothetical protein